MKLMMYLGNDLIESVPLELDRISKPGYIGHFKRLLKQRYNEMLMQCDSKPEFLVIEPAANTGRVLNKGNG